MTLPSKCHRGVLVIPMLAVVFGLSPEHTVGTSVGISIVLALVSALFYFAGNTEVDYVQSLTTAAVMFAGGFPGVKSGSRLAVKIDPRLLYGIVMALILLAIGMMLAGGGASGH